MMDRWMNTEFLMRIKTYYGEFMNSRWRRRRRRRRRRKEEETTNRWNTFKEIDSLFGLMMEEAVVVWYSFPSFPFFRLYAS
ncbi:hypothetical protein EYC84_001667 [Monilinia fructicola]|uniref:Uncharacterized protein n=1 Tax=Monilinia fructicola TaxID=38448 RepID=A0A5M9JV72_MONFR|nr:hypothetical protein EYC84_001667 [Monilinia fructicola]